MNFIQDIAKMLLPQGPAGPQGMPGKKGRRGRRGRRGRGYSKEYMDGMHALFTKLRAGTAWTDLTDEDFMFMDNHSCHSSSHSSSMSCKSKKSRKCKSKRRRKKKSSYCSESMINFDSSSDCDTKCSWDSKYMESSSC